LKAKEKGHDAKRDRELGMQCPITRRDFLNGVAVGIGGALAANYLPASWAATPNSYYPPALTGMRGSHPGSFEAAHALRDGTAWDANKPTDTAESYDLVVVGSGISGLAAAYFYRQRAGSSARILILDNHDDFGGHAKRNEFRPAGRLLLANGGSFAIESPFPYSKEARGLLTELGVDPPALQKKYFDRNVYRGLDLAYFFDQQIFGEERFVPHAPVGFLGERFLEGKGKWAEFLEKTPLSEQARRDILRIEEGKADPMSGSSQAEKKERLTKISYKDFLLNVWKASADVIPFYQTSTHGLYGIGIDAVPALDCWALHYPGFQGMNLDRVPTKGLTFTALGEVTPQDEYFFHFPDGNASVARLLVRSLIPSAIGGRTAEDVVTEKLDYSQLDKPDARVRIRLNSTAVHVQHVGPRDSAKEVLVAYSQNGEVKAVRGKRVVLACWNMMIPYICTELPDAQKEALHYGVKVPLVYTVVGVKNWQAFGKLGMRGVICPGMYHSMISLDLAVDIGDYKSPKQPDEPVLVRMLRTPCKPGLPARDQHRFGHYDLFTTSFEIFERNIRDQLWRVLGAGGFDPARDIDAITVNRWPHGYAYEYNPLWDPDWPEGQRPCDIARKPFGRIAIANSDAAAAAYADQAVDQAYRAVWELLS
jgi:spermidine dehydrogenase